MYKLFILAILTLLAVVYVSILAKADPGYALISYANWTVEMTLVLLVGGLVMATLLALAIIYLFLKLLDIPFSLGKWYRSKKVDTAYKNSVKGYMQLAEGNYRACERSLTHNINNNQMALINYFSAARAAQEQDKIKQRDEYLEQAREAFPQAELAIGLVQAELQLQKRQYKQALINLLHLRTLSANHKKVLELLKQLYLQTHAWKELQALMKDLRHYRVMPTEALQQLEVTINKQLLHQLAVDKQYDDMRQHWQELDRHLRNNSDLVCYYAQLLHHAGFDQQAGELLRNLLKREFNEAAIALYGTIVEEDGKAQLAFAENLLKQHKNSSTLLLALGRICIANELWGKARDYIQQSIEMDADAEKYRILANLYEDKIGDQENALICYRKGLALASPSSKALPAVT